MRILLVDDESSLRISLKRLLEQIHADGEPRFDVKPGRSLEEAKSLLKQHPFDVAFLDLNLTPGSLKKEGLELLKHVRTSYPNTVPIIMTGLEDEEVIEESLRLGAADYIIKPVTEPSVMRKIILKAQVQHRLQKKVSTLKAQSAGATTGTITMKTKSPIFQTVLDDAIKLKGRGLNVLITGETGVGKEVMARYIWSLEQDEDRPFVTVNCAAISPNLVESILFGHVKGSFTGATEDRMGLFEAADGGDIFLDEINSMPLDLQAKVLRAIQFGEVTRVGDVTPKRFKFRVISATNQELQKLVAQKEFREDLYYRIKDVEIRVPALRERKEDLADLAVVIVNSVCPDATIDDDALQFISEYPWPGNVRELEKALRVAAELSEGGTILKDQLKRQLAPMNLIHEDKKSGMRPGLFFGLQSALEIEGRYSCVVHELEKKMILYALEKSDSARTAAKILGLPRTNLARRMKDLGIES